MLDETVIYGITQCYWLHVAVDPGTNEFVHQMRYETRTTALTELFLRDLREKDGVEDGMFLVDSAPSLDAVLQYLRVRFRYEKAESGTHPNISTG